ncbi:MAG: single-stranded DNA-binding protein [Dolichospermum sp.]
MIIGNIGRDAQSTISNGRSDVYFTVAVDKGYKKADGTKVDITNWYTVWKEPSKVDEFLKKGTKVFIQGSLNMALDNYQGKQSIKLSITNPKITLVGGKNESSPAAPTEQAVPQAQAAPAPDFTASPSDEDLPF